MNHSPGPFDRPVQFIVDHLSRLTGRSPLEVTQLLRQESKLIGTTVQQSAKDFGLVPHVWNQQLMDFYASTDAFLFETATWNFTRMKRNMRQYVVTQLQRSLPAGSCVLCFGDGMGFDSEAISRAGFDVICFEVSGPCLQFAEKWFLRNQSSVKIETDFQTLAKRKFDAIICLDVLEHVQEPPALVREFHQWLNPEGLFIVHAPYYHVDATRPTHLESNRCYAGQIEQLYEAAGFRLKSIGGLLLDPLVFIKSADSQPGTAWGKKVIGKTLTSLCRRVRVIPSLLAPWFTRLHTSWHKELKQLHARYQGTGKGPNDQCFSLPSDP